MRLRMRRHRRNLRPPGGLRITSMMDILTVLLLFLLKSFVAEGEAVTPAPGVDLPRSESEDRPPASLVIAITDDAINLGDETVAVLDGSVDGGLGEDFYIEALGSGLERARNRQERIAARRGRGEEWTGRITIQGDRDMSFSVLQRVMYTCDRSGFDDLALAVLRG